MEKKTMYGLIIVVAIAIIIISAGLAYAQVPATYGNNYTKGINDWRAGRADVKAKSWGPLQIPRGLGLGKVEVSDEYKQMIVEIINNDQDTKYLIDEGYEIVVIKPIIRAYIQEDGTVVLRSEQALVVLTKDDSKVVVLVDTQSKTADIHREVTANGDKLCSCTRLRLRQQDRLMITPLSNTD